MSVINTNINALFAQNALQVNARNLSSAMQQLATGSRINSAKDDAAGLAIADTMTSQIRGLTMAAKNGNDAINLLQTAEGAMSQQTAMLQRMRELAVQASSDTVSDTNKGYLDTEFQALLTQIDQIGDATQWNGANVLDASGGASGAGTYVFQVGSASGVTISVSISDMSTGGVLSDVSGVVISSSSDATAALALIDSALAALDDVRATLGAGINQLTYAVDNITNVAQNATEGRSRILDTDYATASSQLAKAQIIQQAATAMLAQANQQPQTVLALLK